MPDLPISSNHAEHDRSDSDSRVLDGMRNIISDFSVQLK
jgi:hypothetical protein